MSALVATARAYGRRLMPAFPWRPAIEPSADVAGLAGEGLRQLALVALGPALVVAALISLGSEHLAHPGSRAAYLVATVAAPVLVGFCWWWRRPQSRIGTLLVGLGYVTWLTSFQGADAPLVFVMGIAAEPALVVMTVLAILAFPSGRLEPRNQRAMILLWAALTGIAWGGALVLISDLAPASPIAACLQACPPNPIAVAALPAVAMDVGWVLVAGTTLFAVVATGAMLSRRLWRATTAQRRELLPVFVVACFYLVAFTLHHGVHYITSSMLARDATEGLLVAARLLFPLGFLASLVAVELFAVDSARRLASGLRAFEAAADIESGLRRAVRDPKLRLGIWDVREQAYRQPAGELMARQSVAPSERWFSVRDGGERLAAIVTDAGLAATPQLIEALTTATRIEVGSLVASAQATALRSRAVESSDAERRRIARDLHDGAQQRLVALRIQVSLASEQADALGRNRGVADRLASDLDLAIDELRRLARRSLSTAALGNGIVPAIRSLAENWPIRATVHARGLSRHAAEVELAVYNCCLEALQNVADHAGQDAEVEVRLIERHGSIHFAVIDNGVGFDPVATERGAGLARIVDRAVLAGGCALIKSAPGRGVRVSGLIPASAPVHAS